MVLCTLHRISGGDNAKLQAIDNIQEVNVKLCHYMVDKGCSTFEPF